MAAITTQSITTPNLLTFIGSGIWVLGFGIEALADQQKNRSGYPSNSGKFIQSGLWAWSRHPNYVGEILLWLGIAVIALPHLQSWQYLTLISPVFIYILLSRISGVPMLEEKSDKKWGGQPDYEAYKARTPVLFPLKKQLK